MLFFLGDEFFIGRLGDDASRSAVEARAIVGSIVNTGSIVVMVIIRPIVVVIIVKVIIRSIVVMVVVRAAVVAPIIIVDVLDAGGRHGAFERRRREREGGRGAAQDHEHCHPGESAEHAD